MASSAGATMKIVAILQDACWDHCLAARWSRGSFPIVRGQSRENQPAWRRDQRRALACVLSSSSLRDCLFAGYEAQSDKSSFWFSPKSQSSNLIPPITKSKDLDRSFPFQRHRFRSILQPIPTIPVIHYVSRLQLCGTENVTVPEAL